MPQHRLSVGVIGAGPAGTMAAIQASRQGARTLLFDTNDMVGRKLLVTGNGRCNISNLAARPASYVCTETAFLSAVFCRNGPSETLAELATLGIPTSATHDGWCYPLSNSGACVADALSAAADLAGVVKYLKTKIDDVIHQQRGFRLSAGGGSHSYDVDRVIMATGGKAYPALGSKGSLFPAMERLGHHIEPICPALAPIVGHVKQFHKLQGVRLDVALRLLDGEQVLGRAAGNLMFTQEGFSGPAAMDLSHLVSMRRGQPLTLSIDLLHDRLEALMDVIARWRTAPVPVRTALGAVLPAKLPPVMLSLAGVAHDATMNDIDERTLETLLGLLGDLRATVHDTRGFRFAQLSTGGVRVNEVDGSTMQSRIVPGLYLAGEMLDVMGPCGGYNLQFAFATGAVAGRSAATP